MFFFFLLTLQVLQDQCLKRKQNEIDDLFQEEYGVRPEEVFETFDPEPIAAASLAQASMTKLTHVLPLSDIFYFVCLIIQMSVILSGLQSYNQRG